MFTRHCDHQILIIEKLSVRERRGRARLYQTAPIEGRASPRVHFAADVPARGARARDEYSRREVRVLSDEVARENLGDRGATDVARADHGHS